MNLNAITYKVLRNVLLNEPAAFIKPLLYVNESDVQIQFNGFALICNDEGHFFISDTSGG